MTVAPAALDALRGIVPSDRLRAAAAYVLDGVTPAAAFRPETPGEVAALLAAADRACLAVAPLGALTQTALGRPREAYDVAIDTTALDRVIQYEPADLTITVEAGITLQRLQEVLGGHGQYLPVDPPPGDNVTIGGLLATARPGAWRGQLPNQRDLILGITAATPEGTLVHSGGRVVKNVSGYDVHRMHTGALGAFGVIVEATFKLAPRPPVTRSFAVQCATIEQAADLAFGLWDQALPLRALSLLAAPAARAVGLADAPCVLLESYGTEVVLQRCEDAVRRAAVLGRAPGGETVSGEQWAALRGLAGAPDGIVLRLGVPPSQLATAIDALIEYDCTPWGHLAAGSVLAHAAALEASAIRSLRERAHGVGGFLQIESAPPDLRRTIDPFDASEVELVRSLKQQFDPRSTLNRGIWEHGI